MTSKSYANILLYLSEKEELTNIYQQFREFFRILDENNEIEDFLTSNMVAKEKKKNVIDNFPISEYLKRFFHLLIEENEIGSLRKVFHFFQQAYYEYHNSQMVVVTTAQELTPEQTKNIQLEIEKKIGKKAVLKVEVDRSLILGIKIRINNQIYDYTVSNTLDQIKREIGRS